MQPSIQDITCAISTLSAEPKYPFLAKPTTILLIWLRKSQNISNLSPLKLSTIVYESEDCWILVKEVINGAVLMAITRSKRPEVFSGVMGALNGEVFNNLKIYLKSSEF